MGPAQTLDLINRTRTLRNIRGGSDRDRYELAKHFNKVLPTIALLQPNVSTPTETTVEAAISALLSYDSEFEIVAGAGTPGACTVSTAGGLTIASGGTSGNNAIIIPIKSALSNLGAGSGVIANAWNSTDWNSAKELDFRCSIRTPATITSMTICAGLKISSGNDSDLLATGTDTDSIFFRYGTGDTISTRWQVVANLNSTTPTIRDTANTQVGADATVAASTNYRFGILVDASRNVRLFINDKPVTLATPIVLTDNITFRPFIGVQTGTSAARSVTAQWLRLSRVY